MSKLEQVRARLAAVDPACAELPLLRADSGDPASLRELAEATKVVITTVGPYIRYGEPLVAACAAAGTDYVDLTGEPEFVDRMYLRYHEQAERSGARIVHSCGFDSIPYDLGVQFTVEQLPEGVPISVEGFVRSNGSFSGGTYQSAIEILGRLRSSSKVARERRRREGDPPGRRVKGVSGQAAPGRLRRRLGRPIPDDRSRDRAPLGARARPLRPRFQLQPLRGRRAAADARRAERRGRGGGRAGADPADPQPAAQAQELGGGAVRGAAREVVVPRPVRGPRRRLCCREIRTEVSGGDPGYGETSKMLAESALCLAHDDLPERAGQLTPAVAMGPALRRRLEAAGIEFKVLDGRV